MFCGGLNRESWPKMEVDEWVFGKGSIPPSFFHLLLALRSTVNANIAFIIRKMQDVMLIWIRKKFSLLSKLIGP